MVLTASCFGGKFQISEIRPILSFRIPNVKLFYEGLLLKQQVLIVTKFFHHTHLHFQSKSTLIKYTLLIRETRAAYFIYLLP